MPTAVLIAILVYSATAAAVAAAIAFGIARWRLLIDLPNGRSSHTAPTPRGGGLGILIASAIGLLGLAFNGHPGLIGDPVFIGVLAGTVIAALAGLADDIRALSYTLKMGAQIVAAGIAVACGLTFENLYIPGIGPVALGWFGPVLTLVWLIGLTNAYNFMDGIDGLAAGTAVIAGVFLTIAAIALRAIDESVIATTIAAASFGFLLLNLPPARIFMGDVGSQLLGFAFAGLGVLVARRDPSGTLIYIVPLLLFHFLFDTIFTAIRRWRRGEPVTQAHRTHLYQRLTHSGVGHGGTTALLCAMGAMQGAGVLWMINAPEPMRLWALAAALALQIVYATAVSRRVQAQVL